MAAHGCVIGRIMIWSILRKDGEVWELSLLISGNHYDYAGNACPIPQTMAGIEIEVHSDKFQEWYRALQCFRRKQL